MADELIISKGSKLLAVFLWVFALIILGEAFLPSAQQGWSRPALMTVIEAMVFAGIGVREWTRSARVVIAVSENQLTCTQPGGSQPSTVSLSNLTGLRWEGPLTICFDTGDGGTFDVDISDLEKGQKRKLRQYLAQHLSFYEAAT